MGRLGDRTVVCGETGRDGQEFQARGSWGHYWRLMVSRRVGWRLGETKIDVGLAAEQPVGPGAETS